MVGQGDGDSPEGRSVAIRTTGVHVGVHRLVPTPWTKLQNNHEAHGEGGGARMCGCGGSAQTMIIGAPQWRQRKGCEAPASALLLVWVCSGAEGGTCSSARAVASSAER